MQIKIDKEYYDGRIVELQDATFEDVVKTHKEFESNSNSNDKLVGVKIQFGPSKAKNTVA